MCLSKPPPTQPAPRPERVAPSSGAAALDIAREIKNKSKHMSLQREPRKDVGRICCINEKELLALDLNCAQRDRIV